MQQCQNESKEGFWILSTKPEFINWNIIWSELYPKLTSSLDQYLTKMRKIKYPVRIGNIILKQLKVYINSDRSDVPLDFHSEVRINGDGDNNFFQLEKLLEELFGKPEAGWKRNDSLHSSWNIDGLIFSLHYWYTTKYQHESGYASLQIENKKIYSHYLENGEYEKIITVDKLLIFEKKYQIYNNYRRCIYVKNTPLAVALKIKNNSAIWLDVKNKKLGFSSAEKSLIFPIKAIKSLALQNIYPAKGGGGSYLEVTLKDGKKQQLLSSDLCYDFDKKIAEIENLTNFKLEIRKPFYDC